MARENEYTGNSQSQGHFLTEIVKYKMWRKVTSWQSESGMNSVFSLQDLF